MSTLNTNWAGTVFQVHTMLHMVYSNVTDNTSDTFSFEELQARLEIFPDCECDYIRIILQLDIQLF